MFNMIASPNFLGAEPLRKRVPAVDEHGRDLDDFMVFFPGLAKKPPHLIQDMINRVHPFRRCCGFSRA